MSQSAYVLVVEDDDDLRDTMQEVLEHAGLATVTARDGLDALRVLGERGLPNVILLDLVMPTMDGWTFLETLRADPAYAAIPVIVTTSAPSRAPAGLVVLRKPVTPELVEHHVRQHMRAA